MVFALNLCSLCTKLDQLCTMSKERNCEPSHQVTFFFFFLFFFSQKYTEEHIQQQSFLIFISRGEHNFAATWQFEQINERTKMTKKKKSHFAISKTISGLISRACYSRRHPPNYAEHPSPSQCYKTKQIKDKNFIRNLCYATEEIQLLHV